MIQQSTITPLNQGESATLIAQASGMDSWQVLSYQSPILPINAALLNTGKVFFFAGSGNDPSNTSEPQGSAVLDLSTGTFSRPTTPVDDTGKPLDIFCAGQSFLPDGKLMVAGGTVQYDPFYGSTLALLFDPSTETWIKVASMNLGRWYPTLVTLGNGQILALSGFDVNSFITTNPEIYSDSSGWTLFSQGTSPFWLYANLFLLENGQIFYSGINVFGGNDTTPRILTLPSDFTQAIAENGVSGLVDSDFCNQGTSVLLPPAQDQKVMAIGGGNSDGAATSRVNIVDLKASSPAYTAAPSLNYARMHLSAVLLPDRTVFVCNGSSHEENTSESMLPAEIYNPATNTWTVVAAPSVPRVYHSVALLLPDGSVLTAGGNPQRTVDELRLEIYRPAYMSQTRPVIQSAPSTVSPYNNDPPITITIETPQAQNIQWVSLIRPSANTHSLDTEQRLVDLPITSKTGTSVTVTVTSNRNLAPPGYYMLFITDNNGVPSTAKWIKLS